MELNNKKHQLNIVGEKQLLEICIYNTNTLTGSSIRLIEFNNEDIDIGVIEFDEGDYLAIFKFGVFYQEYRYLAKDKWIVPTG